MTTDDEPDSVNPEKRMLYLSMAGTLTFAVIGVGLGLYTGAATILFDGFYSLMSLGLSMISLWALHFVAKEDTLQGARYPFGRHVAEPLVMMMKASVMLVLVVLGMTLAARSLLSGGRQVMLGGSLFFTGFSAFFCLVMHQVLTRKSRQVQSDLLKLESVEWRMDGMVSLSAFIGFGLAMGLGRTPAAWLVPYVDPALLLVLSLFLFKIPAQAVWKGFRELMRMAPEQVMDKRLQELVKEVKDRYQLEEAYCRASKVGSTLFIEIDFVTGTKTCIATVKDTDRVREDIRRALFQLPYEPWLTISFTENRKWAV